MKTFFVVLGTLLFIGSCCGNLPSDIEKCRAGDTECIAKVTTQVIQNNPNGKSDLGMPKIEPFRINSLVISEESTGALSLKLSFKDVDITGLSKGKIDRVAGFGEDADTSKFEMSGLFPSLNLKGKYIADGKILVLPIQGDGDAEVTLENVRISCKIKAKADKRNGSVYLGVEKLKALVEPSRMIISLENLFRGDKALGDNMNAFLNENWKDVWTELSPAVNDAIGEIVLSIVKSIFKKIKYDEMFLD